ncbi:cytochrome c oxidase assembly factor 1 homolog isoform X2 [Lissotriton helveticus]
MEFPTSASHRRFASHFFYDRSETSLHLPCETGQEEQENRFQEKLLWLLSNPRVTVSHAITDSRMPASIKGLQQMAIYLGVVSGGGSALMYYYMQKNFARKEYYLSAIDQLGTNSKALEALGAPPLKVHNIRLTDSNNRIDKSTARMKIPVSGTKSGGYLYTSSVRDISHSRWCLQEVVLHLNDGQRIPVYLPGVSTEDMEQGYFSEDVTDRS